MRSSLFVLAALFVGLSTQASVKTRIQLKAGDSAFTLPAAKDDVETRFQDFISRHGKSIKDLATYTKKLAKYRSKHAAIDEHNKNSISFGWEQGSNQFTDLSDEEFAQYHGLKGANGSAIKAEMLAQSEVESDQTYNYTLVDWVAANRVAAVRNQGQCGSCWAFASAAVVESAKAIKANTTASYLSTQQLVDCNTANGGCNGGWYSGALDYIKATGLYADTAYPYTAAQGTCKNITSTNVTRNVPTKIAGYNWCGRWGSTSDCTDAKIHAMLKNGPISVVIDAYPIMSYKTGIFSPTLNTTCTQINHAVVLVGYGYDATANVNYWLVRNSWSTGWGMSGYLKVKDTQTIENDSCYLTQYAFQPIAA